MECKGAFLCNFVQFCENKSIVSAPEGHGIKDVTDTAQGYQSVIDVLKPAGIEIVSITNQTILEQAMKNETICWHFFDQVMLSNQWFRDRLKTSLSSLGPRYNSAFNVTTQTEELFDYFLCNSDAVERINRGKNELLANLTKEQYKRH